MILLQQSFTARTPLLMATSILELGEDARVLLRDVTCTVSVPSSYLLLLKQFLFLVVYMEKKPKNPHVMYF